MRVELKIVFSHELATCNVIPQKKKSKLNLKNKWQCHVLLLKFKKTKFRVKH